MRNIMKLKKYLSFIMLFFAIISSILVIFKLNYLSLIISSLMFVISFIFIRKKIRILIVIFIISICTIITNILILYKQYKYSIDIFADKNILLGEWLYGDNGERYIFEDNIFKVYNSYETDDYCTGEYSYNYGVTGDDSKVIWQDNTYYYYELNLKEQNCYFDGENTKNKNETLMILAVSKKNYKTIFFINRENMTAIKLNKSV